MKVPDEIIIAKYLNNEASDKEQHEIEKWINSSEENFQELGKYKLIMKNSDIIFHMKHFNAYSAWNKIDKKINPHKTQVNQKSLIYNLIPAFYKYAALIVIVLLLGFFGYKIIKDNLFPVYSEISSGDEQNYNEYVLPDGSVVVLNVNTTLNFPKRFSANIREVSLSGEAFFDIKPDPGKPFIINAGDALIKVLGTSFDILAYPDNETLEIIVETGTVEMTSKNSGTSNSYRNILIHQGEKGTLFQSENKLEKSLNKDANYLAWKTQNLKFDNSNLDEVTACLEKIYHVDIELQNDNLKSLKLTAEFEKKPVEFILNVIKLTFGLELTSTGDKYIFSEQKTNNE